MTKTKLLHTASIISAVIFVAAEALIFYLIHIKILTKLKLLLVGYMIPLASLHLSTRVLGVIVTTFFKKLMMNIAKTNQATPITTNLETIPLVMFT